MHTEEHTKKKKGFTLNIYQWFQLLTASLSLSCFLILPPPMLVRISLHLKYSYFWLFCPHLIVSRVSLATQWELNMCVCVHKVVRQNMHCAQSFLVRVLRVFVATLPCMNAWTIVHCYVGNTPTFSLPYFQFVFWAHNVAGHPSIHQPNRLNLIWFTIFTTLFYVSGREYMLLHAHTINPYTH